MPLLAKLFTYRFWLLGLVALAGFGVSLGTWDLMATAEKQRALATFRRRADSHVNLVRLRLQLYEEMVHNLHNLVAYSEDVTRPEFEAATANLLRRFSGVRALQWLVPVSAADLPGLVAAARADYPDFTPAERTPSGEPRALQPRDEYTLIRLVAPLAGNERALGYDVRTAPNGDVLTRALQSRTLAVSQPFRLIQSSGPASDHGVVFALAVFDPTDPTRVRGYVQGVFDLGPMLASAHRAHPDETVLIHYLDLDAPIADSVLYVNQAGREVPPTEFHPQPAAATDDQIDTLLPIGQRRWQISIRPNPFWQSNQRTLAPWLTLAAGFCTTCVALFALSVMLRRGRDVENQVSLRTTELRATQRALEDDIQRRREIEAALHASESRLQAILDHSPAIIFLKDLDGRYLLVNHRYETTVNRPRAQIIGRRDSDLFPSDVAAAMAANDQHALSSATAVDFEETLVLPDRTMHAHVQKFPLKDVRGTTYALGGIVTDVTERKRAEAERHTLERRLQAKQRLESLGVLAGGIAHDFNNILTGVLGNASLIRTGLRPSDPSIPLLQQIEFAARRAADLCTKMLAYAGKRGLVAAPVDVSALVRDNLVLLEASVFKSVSIKRDLEEGLPIVQADAAQIRQVVMNLVINAAEAIGSTPGEIALSTFRINMSATDLRGAVEHPELPAGDYVALEVRDTGCGMNAETIARIFDPFFTTKFSGRGLGLPAVLGIVRSHHGALFVQSTPGAGSIFRLLLPSATTTSPASEPAARTEPFRGTVMVVDDETPVRDIAGRVLARLGLTVIEATNGQEALTHAPRCQSGEVRLVLLDLTMPGLSGEETLRELHRAGSTAKVILMSGYNEEAAFQRCREQGAVAFVQKPFDLPQLISLLETHLGRK